MPKIARAQKGSNKKHTSTTAASTSQSQVRRAAVATARKNSRQGGKPRKQRSHQQTTETRDLLDAEFRDLHVKTMGQQEDPRNREGATAKTGFSAYVSEGSVQDLAGVMSALRTYQ